MNFTYDPSRHPPEVGRVLGRMKHLIDSGQYPAQNVVGALCQGIREVAAEDGVAYEVTEKIVFGAIKQDKKPL